MEWQLPYGSDLVKSLGHILKLWFLLPNGNSTLWTSLVKALAKSSGKNCLDSSCGLGKNKEPRKSHSHQKLISSPHDLTLPSHGNNPLFAPILRIIPCSSGSNVESIIQNVTTSTCNSRCLPTEEDSIGQSYSWGTSWCVLYSQQR